MKLSKNTHGFAVVEGLLILVIVGILGGVGWYVYDAQKKSNASLDKAGDTSLTTKFPKKDEQKPAEQPTDETKDWTKVEFKKIKYYVLIPDGWSLKNIYDTENEPSPYESYFTFDKADIIYKAGTRAKITEVKSEPRLEHGDTPYFLFFPEPSYSKQGDKQNRTLKTKSGHAVEIYMFESKTDPDGVGDWPKGTKAISYYVDLDGQTVGVRHVIKQGDTDQTKYIEKSVETIDKVK